MVSKCFFIILIMSYTAISYSGISGAFNNTDTLDFYQGIHFSQNAVKGLPIGDSQCTSDVDFFITTAEKCCLVLNCHCGIRFGSKYPLYFARKKFDSFDFNKELDLTDSSLFTPAAKLQLEDYSFCSDAGSFLIESDIGELDLSAYEQSFFVVKTREHHFILIRISHLITYCWDVGQPCLIEYGMVVDSKVQIDWITGKNNTPFFPDLIPSKTVLHTKKRLTGSRMITRYDLQGKKINDKNNFTKSGVIITKYRDNSCQKMLLNSGWR